LEEFQSVDGILIHINPKALICGQKRPRQATWKASKNGSCTQATSRPHTKKKAGFLMNYDVFFADAFWVLYAAYRFCRCSFALACRMRRFVQPETSATAGSAGLQGRAHRHAAALHADRALRAAMTGAVRGV